MKIKKPKRENEPLSSLTHLIGVFLSIAGLVLLIVFSALYGSAWHIVGFSVFGASLILVYSASTIYHFISKTHKTKRIFQKIDQSTIYILIAGTYTPILFTALNGWIGWSLFGVVWVLAVSGTIIITKNVIVNKWFFPLSYIVMGWLVLIVFFPFIQALPKEGIFWALTGGLFYTFGVVFFSLDSIVPRTRWFGMHEVFHIFVILGSFSHFWLMLRYVIYL